MADKVKFSKVSPKHIQWLNVLKCFQDLIYFEIEYALEKTNNIPKSRSTSPLGKSSKKNLFSYYICFSHDISFEFVGKILDLGSC